MRKCIALIFCATLIVARTSSAAITIDGGPTFGGLPTGPVTYSTNGVAAIAGTQVRTYSDTTTPTWSGSYQNLWLGIDPNSTFGAAMDGAITSASAEVFSFFGNTAPNQLEWRGSAIAPLATGGSQTVTTRAVLVGGTGTSLDLDALTLAGLDTSVADVGDYFFKITADTFLLSVRFEGSLNGGSTWSPIRSIYDSLHTSGQANQLQTSIGTGFYYENLPVETVPEPASLIVWSVLGLTVAGGTWWRRRNGRTRN